MNTQIAGWSWKARLAIAVALCLCLVVSGGALAAQQGKGKPDKPDKGGGGKQTPIGKLTFNDTVAQQSGTAHVLSDGFEGLSVYSDRRWPADDPIGDPDGCVTAIIQNTDGAFVHLDRGSGSPSSPLLNDCNGNVADGGVPLSEARTYTLVFPAASCGCNELGLTDNDGDGYCSLTLDPVDGAARISTSSLFKKKDTTADIRFLFKYDVGTGYGRESFDLGAETQVPVIGSGDIRTLEPSYETFRLTSLDRGDLCTGIPLAFSIQFERKDSY